MGEFMTPSEAADLLHVTLTTFRRYCENGHFGFLRTPGGKYRVKRADVEQWIADNMHEQTQQKES